MAAKTTVKSKAKPKAKVIKRTTPYESNGGLSHKSIDISDRTFMVIIFSVIMGFTIYMFTKLDNRIDRLENKMERKFEHLENKIDSNYKDLSNKIDKVLLHLLGRK